MESASFLYFNYKYQLSARLFDIFSLSLHVQAKEVVLLTVDDTLGYDTEFMFPAAAVPKLMLNLNILSRSQSKSIAFRNKRVIGFLFNT